MKFNTQLLIPNADQSIDTTLRYLRALPDGYLRHWLQGVVESDESLGHLAANAQWHPNGFLKCRVASTPHGHHVRLHIWLNGINAAENIHTHRWDFASRILCGELVSEQWTVGGDSTSDDTYVEHLYTASDIGADYRFDAIGYRPLTMTARLLRSAGDNYIMRTDELHSICAQTNQHLTATLMITHPPRSRHNLMYSRTARSGDHPKLAPTPERVRTAFAAVLNAQPQRSNALVPLTTKTPQSCGKVPVRAMAEAPTTPRTRPQRWRPFGVHATHETPAPSHTPNTPDKQSPRTSPGQNTM